MTVDDYLQAKVKHRDEWIPVKIMVLIEKWAMVRRADIRGAMPFVVSVNSLRVREIDEKERHA